MPQGQDRVEKDWQLVWVSILEEEYQQEKQIRAFFPPLFPECLSFDPLEGNWWAAMLCAGLSLRPFVACFLLMSEMLDNFSYLAWPLPSWEHTSPSTGSVLTRCSVERKFSRKLEKNLGFGVRRALKQMVWISAACPAPLWRCCEVWDVSCALDGSGIAILGEHFHEMEATLLPLCSQPFTQQQFLISREVICGYNLDCPANCWMPEEAGGECAASGCVGFSV